MEDFPDKVQVGLNAYTDFYSTERELMRNPYRYNSTVVKYGKPDLRVEVDYIRFEELINSGVRSVILKKTTLVIQSVGLIEAGKEEIN